MSVGVLGAGKWGRNIISTFAKLGALEAIAEPDTALREAVRAQHPNVRIVADHRKLLRSDVKSIAIATPAHTHAKLAEEALRAGKDVLVEKPLCLSAHEADGLAKLAREKGRILMVGHMLLYEPAYLAAKTALAEGRIGRLLAAHQDRLNFGTVRAVENALWSLGVHDIAVLLDLAKVAPAQTSATGGAHLRSGVEDDVHVHLLFASGLHAHLHVSWLWPERRRVLTLVGTEGMIVLDEIAGNVTLHRKRVGADLSLHDDGVVELAKTSGEPLRHELAHFLECVRTRATPRSDGANGAEVVRVLSTITAQLEAASRLPKEASP